MDKKKILLDLNIDGDCTNLGALAVLNVLASAEEAEILATTACYQSPLATGCIKAINRYYGHGSLPVGILHRQKETNPTNFLDIVNKTFCPDFPEGEDVEDTVTVMRRALAGQEDESVILVVVGCFASVAALLQSEPDALSPLSGQELCDRKVTRLVAMAGAFDTLGDEVFPENNVVLQIPAAQYVTEHWTKELVLSGFEIGIRVRSLKEFRNHAVDGNPLKMIYNVHEGEGNTETDNPSWDHTAVLEAVFPGRYFDYHAFGKITVTDQGITQWHADPNGRQTYLLPKTPLKDVAAVINTMIFPEWKQYAE